MYDTLLLLIVLTFTIALPHNPMLEDFTQISEPACTEE